MDGYQGYYSTHSRTPTRLLGRTKPGITRRHHSGMVPRIPRDSLYGAAEANRQLATRRRRWLLSIFGRMMARFYERHERHLSAGRLECTLCHRRIVTWAWISTSLVQVEIVHEDCINRSMWEVVLQYEHLVRAGYASYAAGSPPGVNA